MEGGLIEVILTAVGTGLVSSLGTISALRVHINYLRESLQRHEAAIERAHQRLDKVERQQYGH